jgi:hypothetical protein
MSWLGCEREDAITAVANIGRSIFASAITKYKSTHCMVNVGGHGYHSIPHVGDTTQLFLRVYDILPLNSIFDYRPSVASQEDEIVFFLMLIGNILFSERKLF